MLFQDTVDKACRTVQPAAHTSGRDNVFILRSLLIKPAGQPSLPQADLAVRIPGCLVFHRDYRR